MSDADLKVSYAVRLARLGLKIAPLRPRTKLPFGDISWEGIATTDESVIRGWFAKAPSINYLVNPGERFVVIDLDVHHDPLNPKKNKDGMAALETLHAAVDDWDRLDNTFVVTTPSGGKHLYLRCPIPVSNAHSFPAGIDVRGQAGYVVGPGCYYEGDEAKGKPAGFYTIDTPSTGGEINIAQCPGWALPRFRREVTGEKDTGKVLIDLDTSAAIERAEKWLQTRSPAIEGSNGNDHTFATFVQVKDFGVSPDVALGLVCKPGGWNSRCEPSWSIAELETICHNAYKYGRDALGSQADTIEAFDKWTGQAGGEPSIDPDDFPEDIRHLITGEAEPQLEAGQVGKRFKNLLYLSISSLLARNTTREMIIRGWLPAQGFTGLLAQRGTGKTVTMVDMAMTIACDQQWHEAETDHGWVSIYICGEDDVGAEQQIRAWQIHHGMEPEDGRFIFAAGTVDLLSAQDCHDWAEEILRHLNGRRAVLFVDTWQRATAKGSQNDDVIAQTAVHHIESLAKTFRGPAVCAFHPPKANIGTILGSSVIENASYALWSMEKTDRGRELSVIRMKGPGEGNLSIFDFREVPIGIKDQFDVELTGIIPDRIGGNDKRGQAVMDDKDRLAREAFGEGIRELMLRAERDIEYQKNRMKYFSMTDTAERLAQLSPQDVIIQRLAAAGQQTGSDRTYRRALSRLFENGRGNNVVRFEDGLILSLKSITDKKKKFAVEHSNALDGFIPAEPAEDVGASVA